MTAETCRALEGVRVVDASRVLAGPFACQLLADLGADVLSVEDPRGDPTRRWGPPFENGESAYFRCANRGKEALFLDLRRREDRLRLDEELAGADVFVENFLPDQARRFGLEPGRLRRLHPRLVVASVRAFASDVEARDRPGFDLLMQAEAGWMAVTGEAGGRPIKVGFALVDVVAGLFLANAVQAALRQRDRTGAAPTVEVPLFEAALSGLVNIASSVLMTDEEPRRLGNAHPNIVPYETFRTRDGEVAVACGTDEAFARLLDAFGVGKWLEERPQWRQNDGRVRDREEITARLAELFGSRSRRDVEEALRAARVPAGPVRGVREALREEQGRLHRACAELDRDGTAIRVLTTPILFDGRRALSDRPPPKGPPGGED